MGTQVSTSTNMRAVFALLVAVTVVVTAQANPVDKRFIFDDLFSSAKDLYNIAVSAFNAPDFDTIVKQVTDKMSETNTPENQTACDSVCTPLLSPYVTPLQRLPVTKCVKQALTYLRRRDKSYGGIRINSSEE